MTRCSGRFKAAPILSSAQRFPVVFGPSIGFFVFLFMFSVSLFARNTSRTNKLDTSTRLESNFFCFFFVLSLSGAL